MKSFRSVQSIFTAGERAQQLDTLVHETKRFPICHPEKRPILKIFGCPQRI